MIELITVEIITILIWVLVTLAVTSLALILGRMYGIHYPIAFMAVLIALANILANKMVAVGPFSVPGGTLVFSMTFLITDALSEVWGKSAAKKAVWAGFFGSMVSVLCVLLVLHWTPAPFAADFAELFNKALALTPRITIASLITYLLSQHHDVWAFHFWKRKTKGKHLWIRNNLSTIVSQLIDSALFTTIAFYGVFPVLPVILSVWSLKVIIALLDTPFMYLIVWVMDVVKVQRR